MANGNKLLDQKAIDTIIDSILKAVEIKSNKKSSEGRGKDGKDGRDGKNAPQINDDEALSTNPWSGLKTKEEIAKVEGKIYPCTAQVLEDMTQEQQAELYTQGYRAIKTENNGTVVLLGLGSDGSLEWLGSNQPRGNLLDNPNFAVAQAGYGGFHGLALYAADMWLYNGEAGQVSFNGGLVIETQYTVYQRTQNALNDGKTRTVVVRTATSTGCLILEGGYVPVGATGYSATYATGDAVYINKNTADAGALVSVELYEGNYTPKTLPPWEAPYYVTEYLKCRRYYKALTSYGQPASKAIGEILATVVPSDQMRMLPTAMTNDPKVFDDTAAWIPITVASVSWMGCGYKIRFNTEGTITNGNAYIIQGFTGLTADL